MLSDIRHGFHLAAEPLEILFNQLLQLLGTGECLDCANKTCLESLIGRPKNLAHRPSIGEPTALVNGTVGCEVLRSLAVSRVTQDGIRSRVVAIRIC